ncbi:MAG: RluA family pseudouridine synthase [Kiritimatiellia bacterium]
MKVTSVPQPNDGCDYHEEIGPREAGRTLLEHLAAGHDHSTDAEWRERIAEGRVQVNDRAADPDLVLRRGMKIRWRRPPWVEPAADLDWSVVHEDREVLAVRKPAGLPTLPGANFLQNTLLHQVRLRFPAAAPVHRLGRWTSGLVLCALTPRAAEDLSRQLSDHATYKRYRALATGRPARDEWTVTTPIGPVPHPLLGTLHAASRDGRRALSHVRVLERRDGEFLCDVVIETGRPHQIRIHLAAAGHPLRGDPSTAPAAYPRPTPRRCPATPGTSCTRPKCGFVIRERASRCNCSARRRGVGGALRRGVACRRPPGIPPARRIRGRRRAAPLRSRQPPWSEPT